VDRGAGVIIRPAAPADVPQVAAIVRSESVVRVYSDRGWQHRWQTVPERARLLALVAQADRTIVGHGTASLDASTSVGGAGKLGVTVVAAARGQGVGTRLYDALLDHLRTIGANSVLGFVVDDAGVRFAHARGFEQVTSAPISSVDPRTVTLDLPDDPDIRVVPFTDVRDRPRELFELDVIASLDEPSVNPIDAVRYDEWERTEWRHPDLELEGSTAVLAGDSIVALTWLRVDIERGRGVSAFTATHPEFRGRGFATRAKLRTIRWAAENGIASIATANDDSNAAMLAVNRRLGFTPSGALLSFQRDI
jgi:GNAT superfamily N-acetyltransferase